MDRAAEGGVHVIYTDGYDHLHKELNTVSKDMLLDRGVKSEISAVLAQVGKVSVKPQVFRHLVRISWRVSWTAARRWRPRRPSGAWRFPAMSDYGHMAERDRLCGGPLRGTHGRPGKLRHPPRFHRAPRKRASGRCSHACANCLKTTTGTSRRPWQGNARARDIRLREERVARLLDDPEKLRELRQQRAERKAEKQQQSKGRYWSMRI